jgi:hypothetical protein
MSNCNHACCRNTQLDDEDEGISKVEIVEDDEDDSREQVLQDQFNLFAMAMALDDDDMAEQAIQGFGYDLILLQTICVFEKWSLSIGPVGILQHAVYHSQRPLINRLSVGRQQSFLTAQSTILQYAKQVLKKLFSYTVLNSFVCSVSTMSLIFC